jgi:shikimate dehydrogenase
MQPSVHTRLFALLGDPVAHSLSPRMQNAAFRAAGADGVYVALRCDAATVSGLLTGIARANGGGNVTLPHKAAAAAAVEDRTEAVIRTGACNTFWLEDGRVRGDNTDVRAVAAVARDLVGDVRDAHAVIAGAGGAAAGAVYALLDAGAARVVIVNRSPARAEELARRLDPGGRRVAVSALPALAGTRFDLAVNATSLGLRAGDGLPLDLETIPAAAALDLVYRPGETAWTRHARALGIPARDGTEVLLLQGAAAFERWWGGEAPLDAMRAALAR